MKKRTRNSIQTIARTIESEDWEIDQANSMRCTAIHDAEGHAELLLCPLAAAVLRAPLERIETLLDDPDHETFSTWVEQKRPEIRKHLLADDENIDIETLESLATAYAAASVVNDAPEMPETGIILGIEQNTVIQLKNGADHPESETGRTLAGMLASGSNFLQEQYKNGFGRLEGKDGARSEG